MYLWYLWLFVILLVAEFLSYNLITIWAALASLVTSLYAYFFPNQIVTQIVFLLVLSIVFIVLTKPLMNRLKYAQEKTNADRLIGMEGVVLEQINPLEGVGQVKVLGQIWSAKTGDGSVVSVGEIVKVEKIEGVKLIVSGKETLCKV